MHVACLRREGGGYSGPHLHILSFLILTTAIAVDASKTSKFSTRSMRIFSKLNPAARLKPPLWRNRFHNPSQNREDRRRPSISLSCAAAKEDDLYGAEFVEEVDEETSYGKKDGATGSGMVAIDNIFTEKKSITEDDLMRAGQLGFFTPEFEATFKHKKGEIVWYKSITHLNQWIQAEIEGYSGQDLEGIQYYMLDITMSALKHDPCVRRENVNENILRSLEDGIPEGEEEYKGGAAMWINPHMTPPRKRQFRPQPLKIKKNVGHPGTMLWRDGPRRRGMEEPSFTYVDDTGAPGEYIKVEENEE